MATTNPLRPNDVVLGTPATRPSSGSRGGAPAGQGWNQQPRPDATPGPDDVLQNPNARPPRAAGGGGSGGWGRRANTSPAAPAATAVPAAPANPAADQSLLQTRQQMERANRARLNAPGGAPVGPRPAPGARPTPTNPGQESIVDPMESRQYSGDSLSSLMGGQPPQAASAAPAAPVSAADQARATADETARAQARTQAEGNFADLQAQEEQAMREAFNASGQQQPSAATAAPAGSEPPPAQTARAAQPTQASTQAAPQAAAATPTSTPPAPTSAAAAGAPAAAPATAAAASSAPAPAAPPQAAAPAAPTPTASAAAPPSAAAAPRTAPAAAPATAANSPTSPSNSMGFSDYMSAARSIGQDAQASATTGAFDESKGAAGRVASITDAGGPLMTAARTRARARMARSGLQNTTLAGQAGEQAVIETATPLAQTDAQLYAQQQIENQRASNQASLANANIRAQTGMAGMQLGENARQFDQRLGFDERKMGSDNALRDRELNQQQGQFDARLGFDQGRAAEDDRYRNAQLSQQDRQFLSNLDLERDKLKADAEQFAQRLGLDVRQLDQQDAQFKAQLSQEDRQFLDGLNLKRDELNQQQTQFDQRLGFDNKQLQQQSDQFAARLGFDNKQLDQQGQQFAADLQVKRDALDQEQSQFEARLGMDEKQLQLNRDQLSQQDRQFLDDLNLRKDAQAQQESQFVRDQQNRITLANLDATNRERLMGIEAEYKQDIARDENISRAWGSMMDSISQINNNPELDQAAKNTMIENAQNGFRAFTNFWNKASGGSTDVSDLLAFGPAGSTYTPPNDPNPPNVGIPEDEEADFNAGYYGGGGHGDR